jgi:hypothetical protein
MTFYIKDFAILIVYLFKEFLVTIGGYRIRLRLERVRVHRDSI